MSGNDHITVYYQGDSCFNSVMAEFSDYVKRETLATQLVNGQPETAESKQTHAIDGKEVMLAVNRVR